MARGLGFTRGLVAYSCALVSMLAGGHVTHLILKPDLTLPSSSAAGDGTYDPPPVMPHPPPVLVISPGVDKSVASTTAVTQQNDQPH
jgi:Domain of unknown function (DUF4516)